jgi:threonine dehydratase
MNNDRPYVIIPAVELQDAQRRIKEYLNPTPLIFSRYFSEMTGCKVFLKLEIMQPTHSFKVRGAFNAILALPEQARMLGVTTASGGNHGLGVALACETLKIPCVIYLPISTPTIKVEAIRKLGAKVILHGQSWDEANAKAIETAEQNGSNYVHAFNDPLVMAGQGTIVLELLEQVNKADLIITSIGGGGLISGIISAVQQFSPITRVAGVETLGADCMAASLRAGHIVELPAITSIADSLGARKTAERQFDIVSKYADSVAVVTDEEAIDSLLEILSEEKLLVEPATACSLAALTKGKIRAKTDETIVIVMCGGNIAIEKVFGWQAQLNSRNPDHCCD